VSTDAPFLATDLADGTWRGAGPERRRQSSPIVRGSVLRLLDRVARATGLTARPSSRLLGRRTRVVSVTICSHRDELIYPNGTPACAV
jgi:hypothetical protein